MSIEDIFETFKHSLGDHFFESSFHYSRGILYALHGRFEAAAQASRKGLDSNPRSPLLRMSLAFSLENVQDYRGALAEYKEILKKAPSRIEINLALVRVCDRLGDLDAAESSLTGFIERFPGHAKIHLIYQCLSGVYLERGDTGKALDTLLELETCLHESVSLQERASLYNNIGILLCHQSRWQEARENFRKALSIFPGYKPAYKNMLLMDAKLAEGEAS